MRNSERPFDNNNWIQPTTFQTQINISNAN